jgi:putative membrane protein
MAGQADSHQNNSITMKLWALATLFAGTVIVIFLVFYLGFGQVVQAAGQVGWGGFGLICVTGLGVEACLGTAWYTLMSPHGVSWRAVTLGRQLRDSVSDLLPFTQVGGMVIGARAVILGGIPSHLAFAGMVVDVTTELIGQIAFITLGLLIGINELRADQTMAPYAQGLIFGTALLIPVVISFVVLQRRGSSIGERMAGRLLPAAVSHTAAFSTALRSFYKNPFRIVLSTMVHLAAWIASGVWLWLIMRLVGANVDIPSAIAIESLLGALRSATVFVPSSVGVQEAGYALLAQVFGMEPEIGLAVSLLKRARDVVVGVPVLLIWQAVEGKRAFT